MAMTRSRSCAPRSKSSTSATHSSGSSPPGHPFCPSSEPMPDRRTSLLTPLRHRSFRLLWAGASASLLGDGVYLVALAWQAYTLSSDPRGLALLGFCATVPQLLALIAGGALSDRMDRRRLLLGADLARLLSVGVVAGL